MEMVSKAMVFAVQAHDGMRRRRSDNPYILHPMEVAVIVSTMTEDPALIAAAVLHDVVEDAGITMEEIEDTFGTRVRELVEAETENKRDELPPTETWYIRKKESLEVLKNTKDEDVLRLWLSDKLANMRAFYQQWKAEGDDMWKHFHQQDPSVQAWYYRNIAEYTKPLSEYPAWEEYSNLVNLVFGKEG